MATNVVNLDALIPREDFAVEADPQVGTPLDKISITHLEGPFFGPDLRKPDFQRETAQWTPQKVVDLIRAFVDADLIPAVILWRSGKYIFVIDGAHRLSALLAWISDDYGDRQRSLDFFGGRITDEQRKVAEKTRKLVNKTFGSYQDFLAYRKNPVSAPASLQKRLSNLSVNSIIAQWVPSTDAESAENSFFKINQAATPIDPVEKRILKARRSASAIAARAIVHAGTGHKYWSNFDRASREAIEQASHAIHNALYQPPIAGHPVTTLDVPVAGKGYNALPFVFDLVNESNKVGAADTSTKKDVAENLPIDENGALTLDYLQTVQKRINRITGDSAISLGLHPVVYFYTRSGSFQPIAFLATSRFVENLATRNLLGEFTKIRASFEDFLIERKEALSLLVHKFGTGARSLPWLQQYYQRIFDGFAAGKNAQTIQTDFAQNPDFTFLTVPRPSGVRGKSTKAKRDFNSGTKTAAYFAAALPGCVTCSVCDARIHKNSMQFDHKVRARDGGSADMKNAQVTHPYCNSTIREQK